MGGPVREGEGSVALQDLALKLIEVGVLQQVGGLETAIDVWLDAIKYLSDLHTPLKDHFDMVERKAHADKCAASGRAWALTINEHTSNKSLWQYVHDAFAHVHEDIMEHGAGDRNDDAILEKGNRSSNVGRSHMEITTGVTACTICQLSQALVS